MKISALQPMAATPARNDSAADELTDLPAEALGDEPLPESSETRNEGHSDHQEGLIRLLEEAEKRRWRRRQAQAAANQSVPGSPLTRALRAYSSTEEFLDARDLTGANINRAA